MLNDCYNSYNLRVVFDGHHLWCSWDDPDLNTWSTLLIYREYVWYAMYIYNCCKWRFVK